MTDSSVQYSFRSFDVDGCSKLEVSPQGLAFADACKPAGLKPTLPVTRVKSPSPLSIRWTHEEKNDLLARAGDVAVSVYARSLLFADGAKPARLSGRNPLLDHRLLGQILAQLGRSEFAGDLAVLAEAVRVGSLPLDEITTSQIQESCHDITELRSLMMEALGKRRI